MDEYLIINSSQYKLKLLADKEELDYYTDLILELCVGRDKYILLKDNILFIKNMIGKFINNIHMYELDGRLNESELGLLYNVYFYCNNEELVDDSIILDNQGSWIGEKYAFFSNQNYTTWFYKYNNNIMMKVTPMFQYFDEGNNSIQYKKFIKEYSDIFKTVIDLSKIEEMLKILEGLYGDI